MCEDIYVSPIKHITKWQYSSLKNVVHFPLIEKTIKVSKTH